MAKRHNDYRLTRRNLGVDISKEKDKVVQTFWADCPNCQRRARHSKLEKYTKNMKQTYQLRCDDCGFKRFWGFVDKSNANSPQAVKGRLIQGFQEYLWDWVREHIEKIIEFEFPEKINIFRGKMGSPRRHKGKPTYSSDDFHPDFLRYIETPEYIKGLSQALKDLETNDPELFDFFFFRASGLSFKEISKTRHFSEVTKERKGLGHGGTQPTEYTRMMNRKALFFLVRSIPRDLLETFESGRRAIDEILNDTSKRNPENWERVICPKCNANDPDCNLCRDGTIPRWILYRYQKKIAEGGTWD